MQWPYIHTINVINAKNLILEGLRVVKIFFRKKKGKEIKQGILIQRIWCVLNAVIFLLQNVQSMGQIILNLNVNFAAVWLNGFVLELHIFVTPVIVKLEN